MTEYHNPVLLNRSISELLNGDDGYYVDVTFGGGGHSREILNRTKKAKLIAFDQDADAQENLKHERLTLLNQNFRFLKNNLRYCNAIPVKGILADLGVSSHQFDEGTRGFTFREDHLIDMRMNQDQEMTGAKAINELPEKELGKILREYGELDQAHRVSRAICTAREETPIETTGQLVAIVEKLFNPKQFKKQLAKLFQAIRIYVNDELEVLREFLQQCAEVIQPGGRLVVISYHSLEDRMVKNFLRDGQFTGSQTTDVYGNIQRPFDPIQNRAIVPEEEEIEQNPRARSAKLRVGIKR